MYFTSYESGIFEIKYGHTLFFHSYIGYIIRILVNIGVITLYSNTFGILNIEP